MTLKPKEKSKGAIIFAHNTAEVNYIALAENAARLATHFLKVPVTLITDDISYHNRAQIFDKVFYLSTEDTNLRYSADEHRFLPWKNQSRVHAYSVSPYDTTLLLDADYCILDDQFSKLWDLDFDYLTFGDNVYPDQKCESTMGEYSLPFVWATAIMFKRTNKTMNMFDLAARVKKNYSYYKMLYNIDHTNYRNDYVFAIADNIVNGYHNNKRTKIPWKLLSIADPIIQMSVSNSIMNIRLADKAYSLPQQSIHVMAKKFLLSDEFSSIVKQVINNA